MNLSRPASDTGSARSGVGQVLDNSAGADTDRQLLARIAQGDRAAIRLLFTRHHARIFRFVARRTGSEALADDLANEVFLDAWRGAARFEGRSDVSTWLLSIARNKAMSALRRTREAPLPEGAEEILADPADLPDTIAAKHGKADILRRAIDGLPDEHREVIDLAYYHEQSVAEIATILGIPAATVKTRMFYARQKLGVALKAVGVERGWP